MSLADVKKNAQERMVKSLETLRADLAKVRTGRAHTGILDHVMVEYYGTPTALTQVANVTLVDARTIGVQPYEKKMANTIEPEAADQGVFDHQARRAETRHHGRGWGNSCSRIKSATLRFIIIINSAWQNRRERKEEVAEKRNRTSVRWAPQAAYADAQQVLTGATTRLESWNVFSWR